MEEHRKKLIQAAAGLYGIVHVRQLCDIVAHYTAEKPTRTQLRALLENQTAQERNALWEEFALRRDWGTASAPSGDQD